MIVLSLNMMTSEHIEILQPVACAETEEKLIAFMEIERAEQPYMDGKWSKRFRKGGPLEWFNGFTEAREVHFTRLGTEDEFAERARQQYREFRESIVNIT